MKVSVSTSIVFYDNLSRGLHRKMILPLLNLDKTEMFLISTYDTMSYGTANKYNTTLEKLKPEIDLAAQRQNQLS